MWFHQPQRAGAQRAYPTPARGPLALLSGRAAAAPGGTPGGSSPDVATSPNSAPHVRVSLGLCPWFPESLCLPFLLALGFLSGTPVYPRWSGPELPSVPPSPSEWSCLRTLGSGVQLRPSSTALEEWAVLMTAAALGPQAAWLPCLRVSSSGDLAGLASQAACSFPCLLHVCRLRVFLSHPAPLQRDQATSEPWQPLPAAGTLRARLGLSPGRREPVCLLFR